MYSKKNAEHRGNQRASSASDTVPARSDTVENQTTSDRVTDGNSHTVSVTPAGDVGLPVVDISVVQKIPVANSFSVLNDMECSDEGE